MTETSKLARLPMLAFYLTLLRRVPAELIEAQDFMSNVFMLLTLTGASAVAIFNRRLGQQVYAAWNGISPWWGLLPLCALFAYGMLRANYEQHATLTSEVTALSTRLAPKVHVSLYVDPRSVPMKEDAIQWFYRLTITNLTADRTIENIQVALEKMSGMLMPMPRPLRLTGDDPHGADECRRTFSLDPNQPQLVDLLWKTHIGKDDSANPRPEIRLSLADTWQEPRIPVRPYEITVIVTGRDMPAERKELVVEVDGNRNIQVREADAA